MRPWKVPKRFRQWSSKVVKRLLLLFLVFLPLVAFAYASPGNPSGFVNDFAGVFASEEKAALETKLQSFTETTGSEIAVVTIKSLDGDTVEDYANELFADWGIGKKGEDNGVLFLFSIENREMRIEVGYGLEGALTDAQSYWILQNVAVPAFREGNYYLGANGVADKIMAAINGSEVIPSASEKNGDKDLLDSIEKILYFFLFVFVWLGSVLGRSKSWWLGGVFGGIFGVVLGFIFGFLYTGIIALVSFIPLGLLFDFTVSRAYQRGKKTGHYPWWIGGSGHGGHGGFGGFGGGSAGGGGASSSW